MLLNLFTTNKSTKRFHNNYEYEVHSWESGQTLLLNATQTRVFAYSPPSRTLLKDEFMDNASQDDIISVRKLDEGTMIHFFWNPDTSEWNISTRNSVGCNYSYTQSIFPCSHTPEYVNSIISPCKTFRQMVADALAEFVRQETGEYEELDDINSTYLLQLLPKEYTYSCLLRHAENHLVYSVSPNHPRLICKEIRKFELLENGTVAVYSIPRGDEVWEHAHRVFTQQPAEYNSEIYIRGELDQIVDPIFRLSVLGLGDAYVLNTPEAIYPVGWALTNLKSGEKIEVKNPRYEELRELRHWSPNMRRQYIELLKNGKLEEYIRAFPQYSDLFSIFGMELEMLTQRIHNAYVQYFIHKRREHIPKQYFVPAAKLHHEVYLPNKIVITRRVVNDYLVGLSTNDLYRMLG